MYIMLNESLVTIPLMYGSICRQDLFNTYVDFILDLINEGYLVNLYIIVRGFEVIELSLTYSLSIINYESVICIIVIDRHTTLIM